MKNKTNICLEKPWACPWQEILEALDVTGTEGLEDEEVKKRRELYGSNRLRSAESKSAWSILVEQFKSLLVILLAVAAVLSLTFGESVEGIAILAVILINAAIGFITELRAVRAMEALQRMGNVEAKVRRSGRVTKIPAENLVPGDIVVLEGGDIVTADLRLIEASRLQVDESVLTGESVPIEKKTKR